MGLKEEILEHHQFRFPQLSPGNRSNEQPFVRFLIFIKKRPDISDEKFHEWWKTVHADLAVSVADFGGHCSRYVQVCSPKNLGLCEGENNNKSLANRLTQLHQTPEHRAELEKYGMEPLPYDGVGEMHLKSLDDWITFQSSPAFSDKLVSKCYEHGA